MDEFKPRCAHRQEKTPFVPGAPAPPDRKRYLSWLRRARNSGNYFLVFRPLYRIMSKLDTLFLQDLINLGSMVDDQGDGWFPCPSELLEQNGWSEDEQAVRFRSLSGFAPFKTGQKKSKERSKPAFVQIARRGMPATRWVRIDEELIETALDEAGPSPPTSGGASPPTSGGASPPTSGGASPPTSGGASPPTLKSNEEESKEEKPQAVGGPLRGPADGVTAKPAPDNGPAPPPPDRRTPRPAATPPPVRPSGVFDLPTPGAHKTPSAQAHAWATQLGQAISRSGRNMGRRAPLKKWAAQMDLLHGDVDAARITATLDWYADNIGRPYVPEAFCAATFRSKFPALESARLRAERAPAAPTPPSDDPAVVQIIEQLMDNPWPKVADDRVAAAVAASVANMRRFYAVLESARFTEGADYDRRTILACTGSVASELTRWFREARREAAAWRGWKGQMTPFVWTLDTEPGAARVYAWVCERAGNVAGRSWAEFLAAIREAP